jgi:hypothetical protein
MALENLQLLASETGGVFWIKFMKSILWIKSRTFNLNGLNEISHGEPCMRSSQTFLQWDLLATRVFSTIPGCGTC